MKNTYNNENLIALFKKKSISNKFDEMNFDILITNYRILILRNSLFSKKFLAKYLFLFVCGYYILGTIIDEIISDSLSRPQFESLMIHLGFVIFLHYITLLIILEAIVYFFELFYFKKLGYCKLKIFNKRIKYEYNIEKIKRFEFIGRNFDILRLSFFESYGKKTDIDIKNWKDFEKNCFKKINPVHDNDLNKRIVVIQNYLDLYCTPMNFNFRYKDEVNDLLNTKSG